MAKWYKKKTWAETDEKAFFAKLIRARKYPKPYYLLAQASKLFETEKEDLLIVSESLLNKYLMDFPYDNNYKTLVLNLLGKIFKQREKYDIAINYFKQSLEFEEIFPNIISSSNLDFSLLVIFTKKTELYDYVEKLLEKELLFDSIKFPVWVYKMTAILSVINKHKNNLQKATNYANLSFKYANESQIINPNFDKYDAMVTRIPWLDKLVFGE